MLLYIWCAMDPINIPPINVSINIPAPWIRHGIVKSPFSYGFPIVFLWFSYGFPMGIAGNKLTKPCDTSLRQVLRGAVPQGAGSDGQSASLELVFFFGLEEMGFLQKCGTGRVNTMYESIMKSCIYKYMMYIYMYIYICNHNIVYLHGTHVGNFGCCLDDLGNFEDFRCQLKQEKMACHQPNMANHSNSIYIYI